ncbi:LysR family transcriptional regulator [Pullulanibacillus sp. KACC 23026]|uniref:LysR family transcriptional regulator n=1 Tax=Pullulanibacillus sp. KACC 23026 TaxID=3028315 RepID=UPI0023AF6DDE|nr:LysR family transcriptional regulator [Pullulanibacillus sp. KACC 23026]WEG10894.1 LysR family transcriptional regulator [Pullulanibacillus sp. KACC 23026]
METKWLHTFLSAAKTENFRKTSELLFISQPTVSVHIKLLEAYLGCKLFEKQGRHIFLTEGGQRFLPYAKEMVDLDERGFETIQRYKQGFETTLKLAVSPLIATYSLPYILRDYLSENPNVEVEVKVVESEVIEELVLSGVCDLGLSRMNGKFKDVTCQVVQEDPVLFVVPHDGMDLETAPGFDIDQLLQDNILLTQNHPEYWEPLLEQLRHLNYTFRSMMVSQVEVTKRFIEQGIGLSFLPRLTIRRELLEGRLLDVDFPGLSLPLAKTYALYKRGKSEASLFLHRMKQLYGT